MSTQEIASKLREYQEMKALLNEVQDTLSALEDEIKAMEKTLALLKLKCWYYETAIKDGNEDGINAMLPDKLPEEIQKLYDISHE